MLRLKGFDKAKKTITYLNDLDKHCISLPPFQNGKTGYLEIKIVFTVEKIRYYLTASIVECKTIYHR